MAEKNLIGELDMYREAGIKPNFSDIAKRYGKDRHTVASYWRAEGGVVGAVPDESRQVHSSTGPSRGLAHVPDPAPDGRLAGPAEHLGYLHDGEPGAAKRPGPLHHSPTVCHADSVPDLNGPTILSAVPTALDTGTFPIIFLA